MIRNLWLIMATYCIFLNCNNFWIPIYILNVWKLHVYLFQKKIKTESVKMLLENNSINNGLTSDLKQKKWKKACSAALYGKTKKGASPCQ